MHKAYGPEQNLEYVCEITTDKMFIYNNLEPLYLK